MSHSESAASAQKRFRIAFSFAGEKRGIVAEVARILAGRFGEDRILYDRFHEAEFARNDLSIYLPNLYNRDAELVVVVVCPNYDVKEWTGLEWLAIHDLLQQRRREEVMLCRFDCAHVDGLFRGAGFIELDNKTPEQFANLILERLALNEEKPRNYFTETSPKNYLLIPGTDQGDSFNDRLRHVLLQNRNRLRIGVDYFVDKHRSGDDWFNSYQMGWDSFILDKTAEWLFTVHPESRCDLSVDRLIEMLGNQSENNIVKRVLFFESGVDVHQPHDAYVYTVSTDYNSAVHEIISALCKEITHSKYLVVYMLLGPDSKPANVRRAIYNKFISVLLNYFQMEVSKDVVLAEDNSLYTIAKTIRPSHIHIVGLPMKTWLEDEAKYLLREQLQFMPFLAKSDKNNASILMLCGNDDIALGAHSTIADYLKISDESNNPSNPKLLFVGFDGSERMKLLIENTGNSNVWAITAEVKVNDMVEKAITIVENVDHPNVSKLSNRPILATIYYTGESINKAL